LPIYRRDSEIVEALLVRVKLVQMTRAARKSVGRKARGRPSGSVMLTPEIERTILSYIEAGAWDYIAAEAAGIGERTFHDWMARGEGLHATRAKTPALSAFARRVREAKARSRAAREIEVARADPKFWLTHEARSKPRREGWTEPVPDQSDAPQLVSYVPTAEEAAKTLQMLVEAGVIEVPRCADPNCSCSLHDGTNDG
jgi:hypothetical protein